MANAPVNRAVIQNRKFCIHLWNVTVFQIDVQSAAQSGGVYYIEH